MGEPEAEGRHDHWTQVKVKLYNAMINPFLLRFAQPCMSPGRATPDPNYVYDNEIDMVRWKTGPGSPLAIEMHGKPGPLTKKGDMEKGEDNKDRRMWR